MLIWYVPIFLLSETIKYSRFNLNYSFLVSHWTEQIIMCLNHEFIQTPSNPIQRVHHFISLLFSNSSLSWYKKKIQCCLVFSVIQFAQSSMETGTPITQLTTNTPNNIHISLHFFLLLDYISLNTCNGILHSVSRINSFFLYDYVINWLDSRVHSFLFFFRLGVCPCLFNFILKYT